MFPLPIIKERFIVQHIVRGGKGTITYTTLCSWLLGIFTVCMLTVLPFRAFATSPFVETPVREINSYLGTSVCTTCHETLVNQHTQSYHAHAFSDPVFKGQFLTDLLPRVDKDPELYQEAIHCMACHSPIDFLARKERILSEAHTSSPWWSGVQCSFCHNIMGYVGDKPGNGNYISNPNSERMLGPFAENSNWHHVYSELHTQSEFCGICHQGCNRYGVAIPNTFTEWKDSLFAANGIQCQDCHMNTKGYLIDWKPVYENGSAIDQATTLVQSPKRPALYTHRFPGAHSETQIVEGGGMALYIETAKPSVSSGEEIEITVYVDNSGTGHKMPSGSVQLRQLWLDLVAYNGDEKIPILATSLRDDRYDVTGNGPFDEEILGEDIPAGTRIYRTIWVDKEERQTLASFDAVKVLFDNRLHAAEVRKETYYLKIPADVKDHIILRGDLNYLPYPSSLARRLGLPKLVSWKITSDCKTLPVQ